MLSPSQDPSAALDNLMGFANGFSIDDIGSTLDDLGGDIMGQMEALGEIRA